MGWLGSNVNYDYANREMYVTGYPEFHPVTNVRGTGTLWHASGNVMQNIDNYCLEHNVDVTSGHSGGPLYYWDSLGAYVVGIHNSDNEVEQRNYAVKYTLEVRNWVKSFY